MRLPLSGRGKPHRKQDLMTRRFSMPVITVAMHTTSAEQKKSLIAALTETAVKVTGIPEKSFIVFIDEYPEEGIGIGGRTLKEIRSNG